MILYLKHYEQLCNRIWAFLPALSYSLHYGKSIIMLWGFRPYLDLFPELRGYKYLHSLYEHNVFQFRRAIIKFWAWYDKHLLTRKSYRRISSKVPLIFADAWGSRKDEAFILEEKERIVQLFTPAKDVCNHVKKELNVDAASHVIRVGVHIRRGDYKTFSDGKYFYDITYYYMLMDSLYRQLKTSDNNVQFVLCSNENFQTDDEKLLQGKSFTGKNIVRMEKATAIMDLYALSLCDYIIGPPSTFSQWASFYGGGRLLFIKEKALCEVSVKSFKPIKLLDRFYE